MKRWGRGAGRLAAACVLFNFAPAVLISAGAGAQEAGFAAFSSGRPDPSAREFARDWEANPALGYATLSPKNIAATKAAIRRYQAVVAQGGWRTLPVGRLEPGSSGPMVALLRERLRLSGELSESAIFGGESYDYTLERAVRRYQAANGLAPTGLADRNTLAALNVPAAVRLKQLQVNLARLGGLVSRAARRYVLVNIPAAQIEAVENGQAVLRHAGVVGKRDRPTPLLSSTIHELNFNPVWRLPPTVIAKDLIPKGRLMQRAGKNVLLKYGIDAYDSSGRKLDPQRIDWNSSQPFRLTYSQQPGKDNPLGFLKINFANAHSVYMHDTPRDSIFGRNFRAASSGCVRVHGIEKLAAWLLADQGWPGYQVEQLKESGERRDVKLRRPVPLYFVYITAWSTADGVVHFRRDLYGRDGVGPAASAY